MNPFKFIFNVLWWFPGFGFIDAILFYIVGALMNLTVVMKPLGNGLIEFAKFSLAPFSRSLVHQDDLGKRHKYFWDSTSKTLFYIYLPIGIFLTVSLIVSIYFKVMSIWGIPFIIPTIKSIRALLNPIGIVCVSDEVKEKVDKKAARREYKKLAGNSSSGYSSAAASAYSSAYSSRTPSPAPRHHHHDKEKKSKRH